MMESLLLSLKPTPQERTMWRLLLGDAFDDLLKVVQEKAQAPTAPIPPELHDVVDAYAAFGKNDVPGLEMAICRWNVWRPFPN